MNAMAKGQRNMLQKHPTAALFAPKIESFARTSRRRTCESKSEEKPMIQVLSIE